jgi:ABC-2 type transport system ATP-binding protein
MEATIRTEGLTKRYGKARGVVELDLEVGCGEVFGYLGPNGAGKTTTIRLLLDLIRPTSGRALVLGLDPRRKGVEVRRRIGYLPGDLKLYDRLTGRELLRFFAALRDLRGTGDLAQLTDVLELELDRPIRELSRGNRQKLGLAQAFMHRPELLVLDEPTSGLDPLLQQAFHELVAAAARDGRTVFLSSHILSEAQRIADRVAIVRDGRLELVEAVETLRARALTRVTATFAEPPPGEAFSRVPGVQVLGRHGHVVELSLSGSADALVKELARHEVLALDSREADLDDIFLALYRGADDAP